MGVAVVALIFSTTGVATGQLPNPLPLQNKPIAPTTTVRYAPDDTVGYSDVRCQPGERAVGGGGSRAATETNMAITGSLPTRSGSVSEGPQPDGWRVYAQHPDGSDARVRAAVVCESP
jgi:hypothetical protein